jgi:hypothetical protein
VETDYESDYDTEDEFEMTDVETDYESDYDTEDEFEIEDDTETVKCYDCAIDVQVFHLWNNVVTEFVYIFGKFIK